MRKMKREEVMKRDSKVGEAEETSSTMSHRTVMMQQSVAGKQHVTHCSASDSLSHSLSRTLDKDTCTHQKNKCMVSTALGKSSALSCHYLNYNVTMVTTFQCSYQHKVKLVSTLVTPLLLHQHHP